MNSAELHTLFERFNSLNALIIGDIMLDSYLWGNVTRISPEAPVPIIAKTKKENRLGGAGNVALNIQSLGANPILCGVIGNDFNGNLLIEKLQKKELSTQGIIQSSDRITTVKTRVIAGNQQILRIDEEINNEINSVERNLLFQQIETIINSQKIDVIIFEDYDKGVISSPLIQKVVALAENNNIPTASDPKKNNFLAYKGITLFKPNLKELNEGLNISAHPEDEKSLEDGVNQIIKKLGVKKALITLSEHGILIADKNKQKRYAAHIRNIADVSGAGDTVMSVAALCLALQLDDYYIANIANLAGGLVCEKVGVVPIQKSLLLQETKEFLSL